MGTDRDNAESKHTNIANTHKHLVCTLQYTMLQWVIDNTAQCTKPNPIDQPGFTSYE